jgi:hypothetical protein
MQNHTIKIGRKEAGKFMIHKKNYMTSAIICQSQWLIASRDSFINTTQSKCPKTVGPETPHNRTGVVITTRDIAG